MAEVFGEGSFVIFAFLIGLWLRKQSMGVCGNYEIRWQVSMQRVLFLKDKFDEDMKTTLTLAAVLFLNCVSDVEAFDGYP